jgi:hypothetical protein
MTHRIIPALALSLLVQVTINLYDNKSRDAGYAKVNPRTGNVDLFDAKSNRLGYGKIQGNQLQLYKNNSERVLTGRPATGSTPRQAKP